MFAPLGVCYVLLLCAQPFVEAMAALVQDDRQATDAVKSY